ncbi:hypothetical protein P175DRAFT_0465447 [Aspergillus ochraceoroseus IBT 24754]|uniref:Zn(2)-C6 fungal-type domain-containing protein n=3 Tax=Aspergillus subgen. Nidulantes TaxID=2720870 RepID=A0A0F8V7X8_9EURO|nr:uncharacterized protein P175DRAFT_0465447 [Aspergillus ochraceoroseus IBT 24754]KKK19091.1 hypothetical protein ARAM_005318 [Aspergillus rambellii]KKK21865.1 hypothetical protein AOCH_002826 [Aspergillus ochraceoroseus]PTU18411.1 hypothetical protein P175DRAFT_0465447 [Aspergillus ochraceoroseus IBT 24754]
MLGCKPPRKHSKTFTGCWTCRTRKVKCDETRPVCTQCMTKRLDCAGYGVRLHWLPPEQGNNTKSYGDPLDLSRGRSQRSQIPFESYRRPLNEDQLDRILSTIDDLEPGRKSDSSGLPETLVVHNFGVFDTSSSRRDSSTEALLSHTTFDPESPSICEPLPSTVNPSLTDSVLPPETLDSLNALLYPSEDDTALQDAFDTLLLPELSPDFAARRGAQETSHKPPDNNSEQKKVARVTPRHYRSEDGGTIIYSPSPAYLSPMEQFLMHHYMHRVVRLFCVIDNMKSPWQKIHLPRALQSIGQMNVDGSTSNIQDALRNALLSISAFILSNDNGSRGCEEEAARWANKGMLFRGKTIRLLKDSVERSFGHEPRPKYKDFLATMLSMISINVMSGDTSTCSVHLDGAFHFIKMARNWKVNYSPKARSLHRIYVYLRTIYESTATRSQKAMPCRSTSIQLAIPELSQTYSTDISRGASDSPNSHPSPESDSHMSTYECIYGVPHHLLILLSKTTELIDAVTDARETSGMTMIPDGLARECDRLESAIMDWPLELELKKCLGDEMSASSEIIRRTARAFHHALVIYFAQHIRLVGHRYLHQYIESVLDCIEAIEKIKANTDCLAAPLYWPAFVAASEAFDEHLQDRFKAWYEQVEMYGIAAVRTGINILTRVWQNGTGASNRITSQWRIEVHRTNAHLMLS